MATAEAAAPGAATAGAVAPGAAEDEAWMHAALALARRGLGGVWPNPAVGCVLARAGRVVGRGWTQPGGRPHAESEALKRAGESAREATAYITLEPCDHHGVTAPCSEALRAAGIARAVIAVEDPDPRVSGRGIVRLREAGVKVTTGVCGEAAADLNLGFFLRITQGRPMVTLKLATSLDGRIATAGGDSRWITGERARAEAHLLRASHDAILIGSGTALTDDPTLTCRLPGMGGRSPLRVIADGRLRLTPSAQVVRTATLVPTWVLTGPVADRRRAGELLDAGVRLIEVPFNAGGRLNPHAMARVLADGGLTRVLLEGGGELAAAFLAAGLIDRVAWFHAPLVIGAEGRSAVAGLAVEAVAAAPAFLFREARAMDGDVLARYARQQI